MKYQILRKDGLEVVDLNRRMAIHERCLNCSGWIPSEVTDCTFTDCHLFTFRTGNEKQSPKKRKEAIRKYCLWCMNGQSSEVKKCVSQTCPLFAYRLKEIDRSVEIDSKLEKVHICPVLEVNTVAQV